MRAAQSPRHAWAIGMAARTTPQQRHPRRTGRADPAPSRSATRPQPTDLLGRLLERAVASDDMPDEWQDWLRRMADAPTVRSADVG